MSVDDNNNKEENEQKKRKNSNYALEEEKRIWINMSTFRDRINNILGTKFLDYYFQCFICVMNKKEIKKITSSLSKDLLEDNDIRDSWKIIYKLIFIRFVNNKIPSLVDKYLHRKAEIEYKFIHNESKKYTNHESKFVDIYIKKMKYYHNKKLRLLYSNNTINTEKLFITKNQFLFPKRIIKKKSKKVKKDNDDSITEKEIKKSKLMKLKIEKQIHQLKLKSMEEVEKSNDIHTKVKKKYMGIKSRYMNFFSSRQNTNYKTEKSNNEQDLFEFIRSKNRIFKTESFNHNKNYFDFPDNNKKSKSKKLLLKTNFSFGKNSKREFSTRTILYSAGNRKNNNDNRFFACEIQKLYTKCNEIIDSKDFDLIGQKIKNKKRDNFSTIFTGSKRSLRPKSSYCSSFFPRNDKFVLNLIQNNKKKNIISDKNYNISVRKKVNYRFYE